MVIVGATKEIGRAAIAAVSRARGMELAGAIDTQCIGQDAGEVLAYFHRSFPLCCLCSWSVSAGAVSSVKWHGRTPGDPGAQ